MVSKYKPLRWLIIYYFSVNPRLRSWVTDPAEIIETVLPVRARYFTGAGGTVFSKVC
ncbi:MAG: hypothetical protein ISR90_00870 [Candidatus Marinimicrobia bacterium]|nr:hypothetical protein [Candidatus Neomarinimicrobiota bacterium]MBL7022596.1 hypothetical protein [Candidatus Neomarinimicrobiota bacterium]MBL7109869.1 hypothetical protein [Candidatus Neomarinimicrobiota bacterium]